MENARQLFGKIGQVRTAFGQSSDVDSRGVIGRAGSWWFKMTLVFLASAIVVLVLLGLVVVSPLILVYAIWTYQPEAKKPKQHQDDKRVDKWQSGKSVDEILGVC